jgi:hypothetical protein
MLIDQIQMWNIWFLIDIVAKNCYINTVETFIES